MKCFILKVYEENVRHEYRPLNVLEVFNDMEKLFYFVEDAFLFENQVKEMREFVENGDRYILLNKHGEETIFEVETKILNYYGELK